MPLARVLSVACLLLGSASVPTLARAADGYEIVVQVDGQPDGEAMLAYHQGSRQFVEQTARFEGGTARFAGAERLEPGLYILTLPPDNTWFELIVDADQHFRLRTERDDPVGKMEIEGSTQNAVFYEDLRYLAPRQAEAEALVQQQQAAAEGSTEAQDLASRLATLGAQVEERRRSVAERLPADALYVALTRATLEPKVPDGTTEERFAWYRSRFWSGVDLADARLLRTPVIEARLERFMTTLTRQSPDALIAATDEVLALASADPEVFRFVTIHLLNKYATSDKMCQDSVYVHIVDTVYRTGRAPWTEASQLEKLRSDADRLRPTLCGAKAPDMALTDASGEKVTVHGAGDGYTVIYAWSPDCGYCKRTGPALAEAMKPLAARGVTLLTVALNGEDHWAEMLDRQGLSALPGSRHTQDIARETGFDRQYDVRVLPKLFLLGPDDTILAKQLDAAGVAAILDHELDGD